MSDLRIHSSWFRYSCDFEAFSELRVGWWSRSSSSVLNCYGERFFLWILSVCPAPVLWWPAFHLPSICPAYHPNALHLHPNINLLRFQMLSLGWNGMHSPATSSHTITDWGRHLSVSLNRRTTSSACSHRNLIIGCISSSFSLEMLDDVFQFKKLIFP